jgi:hypothetical protein
MLSVSDLYNRRGGKHLLWLLALLLALAVAAPVLLAEDEDHFNGRDKVHDPTGAWLVNGGDGTGFLLTVFHKGGTITQDRQGESAFDPTAVKDPSSLDNVISSPRSGVWQKTGWNTFAATLLDMEYHVLTIPPFAPIFQFAKAQYTGKLTESGDGMTFTALVTHFNPKGERTDQFKFNGNGVRIPLEILPNTAHSLPIPTPPAPPQ